MRTVRRRVGPRVALVVALGAMGLFTPPAAAGAAKEACEQPPQPTAQIEDPSWTQSMYDAPEKIWPFSIGTGITVAVIDTGVDGTHPQLSGRVQKGFDFVGNTPEGDVDCSVHGTPVAGIIVARQVSGIGFYGLAPATTILPVRVSDKAFVTPTSGEEQLSPALLAKGIDYAVAQKADLITVTEVLFYDDPRVAAAVTRAIGAGIPIIAAVGDSHEQNDLAVYGQTNPARRPYPAAYDGVIGVGAIDQAGLRLSASQVGAYVDVVAPGGKVLSTGREGQSVYDGTSFAAAHVAAAAALVLAEVPVGGKGAERVAAISARLLATASPSTGEPNGLQYGAGVIDPYRALTEKVDDAPPVEASPYEKPPPDPVAEATAAQDARMDRRALLVVAGVLGGLAVAAVVFFVLPRGRRRRWRTGTPPDTQDVVDDRPEFISGEALFRPPPR